MALTAFQSEVLRLLADNRRNNPESYVAEGLALNYTLGTPRVSRDVDVFHDSVEALAKSWENDRATLEANGFHVAVLRKYESFVEANVSREGNALEIQWAWDSAYRFFPLKDDPVAGFTLHPLDLATNKLAALVGRTEVRDWIDVITCFKHVQPLAFLLCAACGHSADHPGVHLPGVRPADHEFPGQTASGIRRARRGDRRDQLRDAAQAFA